MTVCCDIDCVLNDLALKWLNWINRKYGYYIKYEELTNYNMFLNFPTLDISQVNEPIHKIKFLNSLKPTEGSQAALKYINTFFDLYIITATPPKFAQQKVDWMKYYFPFVKADHLIFTSKKDIIKCDYIIDDCLDYLNRGDCITIQYEQPWNKNMNFGTYKCKNFDEVIKIIEVI